jgi:hypothetical protein
MKTGGFTMETRRRFIPVRLAGSACAVLLTATGAALGAPLATPSLTTTASPDIGLSSSVSGVTLSDSADLSAGLDPTGFIVFTLTGPGGFVFTQTDAANGNGTYTAEEALPTTGSIVGAYTWTATYSGDANNNGANDQGGSAEQTVVHPLLPVLPPPPRSLG